jgi:deazaflavin-dependent oxidoreductase (nitroreductase family)
MAKHYQVNFAVRASNAIVRVLLKLGVPVGPNVLLTVRGRKSGLPQTVPVALMTGDNRRWLVGSFGNVNWVRNLRAAGEATLTRGRRPEHIRAVELSPQEAAPVLRDALATAPGLVKGYFDVTSSSPLAEFEREAPRHPVFEIFPAAAS